MGRQKPPGFFDKWNGIIDFFDNPCNAPWTVYLESAREPAGELAITLLTFGWDDVLRGAIRPTNIRSGRHGRRGRRGKGRGGGIPEIGEGIGKRLGKGLGWQKPTFSQGLKSLWLLDGVIQRGLWYWLVVDAGTDFLYGWTSNIQQSEFCQKQFNGTAFLKDFGGHVAGGPIDCAGVGVGQFVYPNPGAITGGGVSGGQYGAFAAAVAAMTHQDPGVTGVYTRWVFDNGDPPIESDPADPSKGPYQDLIVSGNVPAGVGATLEICATGNGFATFSSVMIFGVHWGS